MELLVLFFEKSGLFLIHLGDFSMAHWQERFTLGAEMPTTLRVSHGCFEALKKFQIQHDIQGAAGLEGSCHLKKFQLDEHFGVLPHLFRNGGSFQ